MIFTSLEFLFLFLPIVLGINFLLPQKARNYWLFFASLVFYGWGEPSFLVIMILSIVFNYFMAIRIDEIQKENGGENNYLSRIILVIDIFANILILFVFKYMNFFVSNLHYFFPKTIETIKDTNFVLPIGISFFTFQALSYVIDVYRMNVVAQKRLGYIGLYISLFPQLIAGPIVRYSTIMSQIENRNITFDSFSEGVSRFIKGFNKKVLLANVLSVVADASWESPDRSIILAWIGGISYTLQILFDFSGYSDMAIGLGKMLGFDFLENFNYPYISKSVSEFWRRWHMSLQTWFRDYVYIPLGGSRVPKYRQIFNLFVVWGLTGIWHGANWTFWVWGLLYFVLLTFEKFTGLSKVQRWWGHIYTLFFVGIGWVFFRSDSISIAIQYIGSMFGIAGNTFINEKTLFYIREYGLIMLAGSICSTNLFEKINISVKKQRGGGRISAAYIGGTNIIQFLLFIVSISYIVMNAHNPFIYFNF